MKYFTSLVLALFFSATLSAQFVVINSPEEIAGAREFGTATAWGADVSSDTWTADAVFVEDATADPNEGCEDLVNGAEVAGKIALVDRGSCNFSLKALNAQEMGAIAAIIFNSEANAGAGVISMGAGDFGGEVTIPAVMLSYEDGQEIRAALENGPVNITIGDVQFANNVGTTVSGLMNATQGVTPLSQVTTDNFIVNPGASVTNYGTQDATNPSVSATITFTPDGGSPSEVYNESGSVEGLMTDSSELILLPEYMPTLEEEGVYEIQYSISSDSTDEAVFDNEFTTGFQFSGNVFTKASWDAENDRPNTDIVRTIDVGGPIEFISAFELPNGLGMQFDSVQFNVQTNAASLANMVFEAYLYDWVDMNEDSVMNNDEMEVVGLATYTFPSDETATSMWLTLPILDLIEFEPGFVIPDNNKVYAIGTRYQGTETTFFGFDDTYDQTQFIDFITENGLYTDAKLPYIGVNSWTDIQPDVDGGFLFTGTRGSVATALYMNPIVSDVNDIVGEDILKVEVFPNPVSDLLNARVQLKAPSDYLIYQIYDSQGRSLFSTRKTNIQEDTPSFNVSALPAGMYYLTIRTEAGMQSKPFVVKR